MLWDLSQVSVFGPFYSTSVCSVCSNRKTCHTAPALLCKEDQVTTSVTSKPELRQITFGELMKCIRSKNGDKLTARETPTEVDLDALGAIVCRICNMSTQGVKCIAFSCFGECLI